jgi:hypothetical protein
MRNKCMDNITIGVLTENDIKEYSELIYEVMNEFNNIIRKTLMDFKNGLPVLKELLHEGNIIIFIMNILQFNLWQNITIKLLGH